MKLHASNSILSGLRLWPDKTLRSLPRVLFGWVYNLSDKSYGLPELRFQSGENFRYCFHDANKVSPDYSNDLYGLNLESFLFWFPKNNGHRLPAHTFDCRSGEGQITHVGLGHVESANRAYDSEFLSSRWNHRCRNSALIRNLMGLYIRSKSSSFLFFSRVSKSALWSVERLQWFVHSSCVQGWHVYH